MFDWFFVAKCIGHYGLDFVLANVLLAGWLLAACCLLLLLPFSFSFFISSHFISFHLISSRFISFHLISSHFISFHLISSHFISFYLISSHFISFSSQKGPNLGWFKGNVNRNSSKFEVSKGIKTYSKNWPQKSWTTLCTWPFTNHFREWAHFIHFPFTKR